MKNDIHKNFLNDGTEQVLNDFLILSLEEKSIREYMVDPGTLLHMVVDRVER